MGGRLKNKVIITVHSDVGARFRGGDQGASELSELASKLDAFGQLEHRDCVTSLELETGFTSIYAKNIEKVLHVSEVVCTEVHHALVSGETPILISGDHSSATGTIAGIKKAKPESRLGVIWVDAHADLHSPFTSCSGNMHGMPLAASLGFDNKACQIREPDSKTLDFWEGFKKLGGVSKKIRPSDIVFVTLRDLEEQERYIIEHYGIKNFSTNELRNNKKNNNGCLILEYLKDCTDLYVSFDIDSLDAAVSKGTGLPVENGLMPNEAEELIRSFLKDPRVTCFEVTEYNPLFDIDDATVKIVYRIMEKSVSEL